MEDAVSKVLEDTKNAKVEFIRLQFTDILGTPKNIVIPGWRLEEALVEGIPFDASSIVGYATIEESDLVAKPDTSSFVILPDTLEKRQTARLNCDIFTPEDERFNGDPKFVLERVIEKAKSMGFDFNTGPECEFFLLKMEDGRPTTVPNDRGGYFDLSPLDLAENVRGDICSTLEKLGFQVYTSHHEVASGQHEINFKYADALTTADRVVTLRYVAKVVALQNQLHATFMPKPIFGVNGTGMHTHQSLFSNGENAFLDEGDVHQLSITARQYIGGLLKYSKEMCAVLNSWVNSYKRLVPGFEAPTYIAWATENRSALIRIPAKRGKGTRCELRNPDPAGNPYLQFAVMLAAGLKGIEKKIAPPEPVEKDIYSLSQRERELMGVETLPTNLGHALSFMEKSELMLETLGPHIFHNFQYLKNAEWNEYRTQVTGWELDRFLARL
jgi:glutamine synthetase